MSKYSKGDRVAWQYRHTAGRSSWLRVKLGTVDHPHKEKGMLTGLYYVHFDGNKTLSLVPGSGMKLKDSDANTKGTSESPQTPSSQAREK